MIPAIPSISFYLQSLRYIGGKKAPGPDVRGRILSSRAGRYHLYATHGSSHIRQSTFICMLATSKTARTPCTWVVFA